MSRGMRTEMGRRARLWMVPLAALALGLGGCIYAPPPPPLAYATPSGGYAYDPTPAYYAPPYYYGYPYYYPAPAYYPPVVGSVGFFFGGGGHHHFR
jgi:hypothetical protein